MFWNGGMAMTTGRTDELKGRVKEAAGALTGDAKLKREGQVDQAVGKMKQTTEKVLDTVKDAVSDSGASGSEDGRADQTTVSATRQCSSSGCLGATASARALGRVRQRDQRRLGSSTSGAASLTVDAERIDAASNESDTSVYDRKGRFSLPSFEQLFTGTTPTAMAPR